MILMWLLLGVAGLFGAIVFFGAPYVPTLRRDAAIAFSELYQIKPDDVVVDLGSGDGSVLREAAVRGATAIGYELNPLLVALAKIRLRKHPNATVQLANFWRKPLPTTTTLVYAFSVSRDMPKLDVKLQTECDRLGRPLYLMSYGFKLSHKASLRSHGAHVLYSYTPLQVEKAQV